MKNLGTIYVIMPAYNVEKFIGTAFNSLLAQTYPNWKCLCVNDGSNDNTWKIMQEYAEKDNRFLIFNHENQGVTKSRNFLLEKVKGPYLAFMDSDDYLHPQMFEILIGALTEKKVDIAECTIDRFIDDIPSEKLKHYSLNQIKTKNITDMSLFLLKKTCYGNWINICNKLYLWKKIKDIKFSENLSYEDDYFYSSLSHSLIKNKVIVAAPLYFYRKNPTSLCHSVNWEKYQKSGLNRILLSWEYFIKGERIPENKKELFMTELTQDAYRMIIRKPLKKGKGKQVFDVAHKTIKSYLEKGIVDAKLLPFKERIHMYFVARGYRIFSLLLAKLT